VGGNESQMTLLNAGKFWSPREDKVLCARYAAGTSIVDLASKHGRTQGAITFRLVKLGKIQPSPQIDSYVRVRHPVRDLDTKPPPKPSTSNCIDCGKILIVPKKVTLFPNLCEACNRRRIEEKKILR